MPLLYKDHGTVHVGEVYRYLVSYTPPDGDANADHPPSLHVRIRNCESLPLRAAYLAGPFILYVDITPGEYSHYLRAFRTADQPVYESQLKASQNFFGQLYVTKFDKNTWTIDVVSQIIFSDQAHVHFEILIGTSRDDLHSAAQVVPESASDADLGRLIVERMDTTTIWHSPMPRANIPIHLVIVTHGLHSNVGADLLYLKDRIDGAAQKTGENVVVRGFFGNVRKTERGVKYQGTRLAEWIVNDLVPEIESYPGRPVIDKISFIAHSLGGLVQTYALAHVYSHHPDFFEKYQPTYFICLASPFLGISNENPAYVRFALDIGFVGKSGRDLGLSWNPSVKSPTGKPLLQILPTGPAHKVLKMFQYRTLYANVYHDGIVPLRTSALLYLDWKALGQVAEAKREESVMKPKEQKKIERRNSQPTTQRNTSEPQTSVGEIPEDSQATEVPVEGADQDTELFGATETKDSGSTQSDDGESQERASDNSPAGLMRTLELPVQQLVNFFMPQGSKRPGKIYQRSQVDESAQEDGTAGEEGQLSPLPKRSSLFESGVSVLLPPLPPQRFIVDPDVRGVTIIHDRIYKESDLPPRRYKASRQLSDILPTPSEKKTQKKTSSEDMVEKGKVEEKMARAWHHDLSWRKVLVKLEPDAHNNIIVRRRYANAYGWPVIDHLIHNHFLGSEERDEPAKAGRAMSEAVGKAMRSGSFESSSSTGDTMASSMVSDSSSRRSFSLAWDRYLSNKEPDSEDEGILNNVTNMLDNFRELGGLAQGGRSAINPDDEVLEMSTGNGDPSPAGTIPKTDSTVRYDPTMSML